MTRTAVENEFMTSVADARVFDTTDNLMFSGKTLMNSNFQIKTSTTDVRGGRGAQLLFTYQHTSEWTGTIQDARFNMEALAATLGATIGTGSNVYVSENVTLSGSPAVGTVVAQPLSDTSDGLLYGLIEYTDGNTEKVVFSGKNFTTTLGVAGDIVCARFYALDSAAKTITVDANILPRIGRIELDVQLSKLSSANSGGIIGKIQILIPRAIFDGNATIDMKMDGTATVSVAYKALSVPNVSATGCSAKSIYGYIIKIVDGASWTSGLSALAIANGDFSLAALATKQLSVIAVYADGTTNPNPPVAEITFASSDPTKATVGLHTGLCTGVAAGSTIISCYPTAATTFDVAVTCTVPS